MKISCQTCQSKYNVADEKVQGKVVKIRCRKCNSTIVVNGTSGATTNGSAHAADHGSDAAPPTDTGANGAGDAQWHVNVGDNDQRTMGLTDLVQAYQTGVVTQDTFIWTEGMSDWKALAEVEAVVSALHGAAGNAGAQAQAQAAQASYANESLAPVPAPSRPAASYEAPAAAYESSRASYAPAAEPKRAAVVRRDARGRGDLFSGSAGEDVQTAAPSVAPGMLSAPVDDAASKLTGQRNENSVLFSLAVLTKTAEDRAPGEKESSNSEDSGMIDLRALSAKAESMRPPAVLADANVFAPPLGAAPLSLGAPTGALDAPFGAHEPPAKSKLPLWIGLGAGVVALLVLVFLVGTKFASGPSITAVPSAAVSAAPAPTDSAGASASPDESANPAPSAAASVAATARPGGRTYGGGGVRPPAGGGKVPGGATTGTATAAGGGAAPPPPPPKKNDCGCNGDLMCLMKCSTH